jgi:CHASE2 domain-containing sensor protein
MEPLAVLVVLPIVIGIAAELALRDTARASLAAAIVSSLAVYACIAALDPGGTWNGLATFLVSPLAIAISLATVLTCFGFREGRQRHRKHHA